MLFVQLRIAVLIKVLTSKLVCICVRDAVV